jgi:hypothetical protein
MLIADLACCLIEEKPLERKQRPDHVFADSLCFACALSPDFTVDIETSMAPVEDLLYQRESDEFFPQKQGENLMGEDFLECLVMEAKDAMEDTIRGCASFGHQTVNMGMEVDAVAKSLYHSYHSWHKLKTCGCVQEFHK